MLRHKKQAVACDSAERCLSAPVSIAKVYIGATRAQILGTIKWDCCRPLFQRIFRTWASRMTRASSFLFFQISKQNSCSIILFLDEYSEACRILMYWKTCSFWNRKWAIFTQSNASTAMVRIVFFQNDKISNPTEIPGNTGNPKMETWRRTQSNRSTTATQKTRATKKLR